MMKILLIVMLAATVSCGSNSTDDKGNTKNTSTSNTNSEKSPCELINDSDVESILAIPKGTPSEIKDEKRTYPTCFYKWETIKFSQTSIMSNQEVTFDYPTEMTIVLVENANKSMFETSTKIYKDGVSENGIGEMAIWGEKMSQLTFLANGYMIHLNVRKSSLAEENKEAALKIAALIVKKL